MTIKVVDSFCQQAIVFRPFKGEVLDAVVTQVNKVEFVCQIVNFIPTVSSLWIDIH